MPLDPILELFLPIILIVIAFAFESKLFGFLGGTSAFFVGLIWMNDTSWVGLVYIALGLYFIVASAIED